MNIAAALLMCVQLATPTEIEIQVKVAIAIAKAKAKPAPVVVPVVKASESVDWQSYATAHADHVKSGDPLVVLLSMPGCAPCKAIKDAINQQAISGVHYAYVDVTEEPETARLLGYSGSYTVPKVLIYSARADYRLDSPTAGSVLATIRAAKAPAKSVAAYSYRVQRIAAPRGYGPAYVEGDSYYNHVTRDHGDAIREVLNRVSIRSMSDRDLFALHSLLHSGLPVGYWDGPCFVFQLP